MGDAREGRLGNVAGVVVGGGGASTHEAARLLARICEQVVVVDEPGESPLARIASGLQAVDAERVLVVDASRELPSAELVLALTAWPESPAVVPQIEEPPCAIYVSAAVLPRARARLEAGETRVSDWLRECGVSVLDDATLAAIREAAG